MNAALGVLEQKSSCVHWVIHSFVMLKKKDSQRSSSRSNYYDSESERHRQMDCSYRLKEKQCLRCCLDQQTSSKEQASGVPADILLTMQLCDNAVLFMGLLSYDTLRR